ncbi:MAG: YvcK family protein [Acidimicrobiales bacterium]|nr:YvcK family protein [Acidimicrobiales bacterium]
MAEIRRVVALGGGHGLASALSAIRTYAQTVDGIVSVADDGGSSGRLRRELGLPAPGDIRRCLSALSGSRSMLARSLEHRFESGPLEGHAVGNLIIAGLADASGDFVAAIEEMERLVDAQGRLHPATVSAVTLRADSDEGTITGQVTIERATGIHNLRLTDPTVRANPNAVEAIHNADQIVIGPGSLFTSVLATAVVPGINDALAATDGTTIYVANVANDRAEARGFGLNEHIRAVAEHGVWPDVVVIDETDDHPVGDFKVVAAPLRGTDGWSHDPLALAAILSSLD